VKIGTEISQFIHSNGRFGHILKIGFIWSYQDAREGRYVVVRLGQDNWHRIMDTLRGNHFSLFSETWRQNLLKAPTEERNIIEECGICKSKDPDYDLGAQPNETDRWTYSHVLHGHPSADGRGLEIRAHP
jgi:hypothetical protein